MTASHHRWAILALLFALPVFADDGVLILGAGENSIRLCPPLVLTREQADFALSALAETLIELGG